MKAIWKDTVLADSDDTVVVERNHYFPRDAIVQEHFAPSEAHTFCGWQGQASYFDVIVGGETNSQAAWYYAEPFAEAAHIKDYVAFWKGVKVVD